MIEGVFFDLGGTLFSYRNVPRATIPLLLDATERLGLNVATDDVKAAYTRAGQDMTFAYADKAYYLHQDFFDDTFRRFLELLEADADDDLVVWYREAHRVAIVDCLALRQDCRATLASLRERGLYLSVVSNIDDDMLEPLIDREDLHEYFDHWTSSEAAQSCKPHQRFFEHALELSRLPASAVLFVGDSPEHDIAGASAAGMRTALITDGGMPPPLQTGRDVTKPDHHIGALADLLAVI